MSTKTLLVVSVISFAAISLLQAQSPTPAESPAASPAKHRTHKKAEATASPAAVSPSPSPARKTLADLFKPKTSASPAAAAAPAATTKSAAARVAQATPAPGGGHGLVWVNTESHVYHKEGSRFYGKTKKGKYVSEADAIKEGDKASKE
jgi:hypothetical protein